MMLDAGHGGRDPGAVYEGRKEADDTLRLTLAVGEILQNHGIDVLYTRTEDVYETPFQKAMEANNAGVDFFLSIHRNSFPTDNQVSGVESLVYNLSGLKYQMAQDINEQLKRTKMPAVLVEAGFINSDVDNNLFDKNLDSIAQAIAEGVLDSLDNAGVIRDSDYRVQAGAFRNRAYAERLLSELMELDYPAYIDDDGPYYRVQIGSYQDLNEAAEMERKIKRAGYPAVIVK